MDPKRSRERASECDGSCVQQSHLCRGHSACRRCQRYNDLHAIRHYRHGLHRGLQPLVRGGVSVNRHFRTLVVAVFFITSIAVPALAQNDQAAADAKIMEFLRRTEISGFVDGYYGYNFNTPVTRKTGPERTFDVNHNSFSLNLAELSFAKAPTADSRGGFRID